MRSKTWPAWVSALVMLAATAACGGSPPTAPSVSAPDSPVTVSASDRLAWNQTAASHAEFGSLQFGLYVDGERVLLSSVDCAAAPLNMYACTAPLPRLTTGPHTLELVAISRSALSSSESPRSAPLTVVMGG